MSKDAILNLASREAETFKAGQALIRKCSITTGKDDEEYRVSLNVAGFNHPVYISIERFTMLMDDELHGILRKEDGALLKGATLTWDHARVCLPGQDYVGADGREFSVGEESSEYIELWNELIMVDDELFDKAQARMTAQIQSGRLTSQVVYDVDSEQAINKQVSLKEKAELAREAIKANSAKPAVTAKIAEK